MPAAAAPAQARPAGCGTGSFVRGPPGRRGSRVNGPLVRAAWPAPRSSWSPRRARPPPPPPRPPPATGARRATGAVGGVSLASQHVPHAPHRVDETRLAVGLELAPQVAHVHPERVGRRAEVVTPNAF